jgi:alkanesulfonate monooxygenase SsuD/methylene tetrahydromethanopterin reductase-like flavin-dependent oxidoreductase (luciferase family)
MIGKTRRGFGLFAGVAAEVIRAAAQEAEDRGYDSFWVNHPGTVDGLAALAEAAAATRRIKLGVGVIPLTTRGPDRIAEGVRQQKLPLDRLLLGIGSPNPGALRRVRDGVRALRAALPADSGAQIVVAALGPKMCRLSGEVADGVLFNWLTPAHARISEEWAREGARAAGRNPPIFYAYVRAGLGQASAARLAQEGARYQGVSAYADHFARMGASPLETAVAATSPEELQNGLHAWTGAVDEVVIRAITPNDTVEQTVDLVRAAAPR